MESNLNSVLIEGTIVSDALFRGVEPKCCFEIVSSYYYRQSNGKLIKETGRYSIHVGGVLAKAAEDNAVEGRCARVVGRLRESSWIDEASGKTYSLVYIFAEHIAYRPMLKKTSTRRKDKVHND